MESTVLMGEHLYNRRVATTRDLTQRSGYKATIYSFEFCTQLYLSCGHVVLSLSGHWVGWRRSRMTYDHLYLILYQPYSWMLLIFMCLLSHMFLCTWEENGAVCVQHSHQILIRTRINQTSYFWPPPYFLGLVLCLLLDSVISDLSFALQLVIILTGYVELSLSANRPDEGSRGELYLFFQVW